MVNHPPKRDPPAKIIRRDISFNETPGTDLQATETSKILRDARSWKEGRLRQAEVVNTNQRGSRG